MVRRIAEIAVNVPVFKRFHYSVPETLAETLVRGHRVLVPFGARMTTGVCVGFAAETDAPRLKPIEKLLHPECRFDEHILELTRWVAEYYHTSWGEVLEWALPPALRQGKDEHTTAILSIARPQAEVLAEAARIERTARALSRLLRVVAEGTEPLPRAEAVAAARANAALVRRAVAGGWLREELRRSTLDSYAGDLAGQAPREEPELTEDQAIAMDTLHAAIGAGVFRPVLLHGVTGSGKTEVYLRALREVIAARGSGLVLLPEIALTPQTVFRIRQGLPGIAVAVLHSMLSPSERTNQWRDIQEGKSALVIGARSAVFAPLANLRLIVVDEEHESSYKQESSPRYHARDVAVMRARMLGIPVVLGSATPSLESMHNSRTGKYTLVSLPKRATTHDLPVVQIVKLEGDFYRADGSGLVSRPLDELIRRRLREREQVLIYLNRRGFATYLHCVRCGFVMRCRDCDVSMTYHRREQIARCHYCGQGTAVPERCPECEMPGPRKSGAGTEKAAEVIAGLYPEARVARLDRDAAGTLTRLRATLRSFSRGEHDILVGTQMVAKGHDFPGVSLVGILCADVGLNLPDFRSAERTFQVITQVAGRAGRGEKLGRVVVQTFLPEHYALRCATQGDYEGFWRREIEHRRALGYPPFGHLVKLVVSGEKEETVRAEAEVLGKRLREAAGGGAGVRVLGPAPAPLSKLHGKYRYQILLKGRARAALHNTLAAAAVPGRRRAGADVSVDVDPQNML